MLFRRHVSVTSIRRCFDVICLFGILLEIFKRTVRIINVLDVNNRNFELPKVGVGVGVGSG